MIVNLQGVPQKMFLLWVDFVFRNFSASYIQRIISDKPECLSERLGDYWFLAQAALGAQHKVAFAMHSWSLLLPTFTLSLFFFSAKIGSFLKYFLCLKLCYFCDKHLILFEDNTFSQIFTFHTALMYIVVAYNIFSVASVQGYYMGSQHGEIFIKQQNTDIFGDR